jgi:predicted DNA-binding transcriptional regulator AlpA
MAGHAISAPRRANFPDGVVFCLPSLANDRFQLLETSRRSTWQAGLEKSTKCTIPRHQLREMVALANSTIYEMGQRGEFPRGFVLSPRCARSAASNPFFGSRG